jgi:hypothetical protein
VLAAAGHLPAAAAEEEDDELILNEVGGQSLLSNWQWLVSSIHRHAAICSLQAAGMNDA